MSNITHERRGLNKLMFNIRTGPILRRRVASASARRDRLDTKFIGVTGSSAKTTTVQLLRHILSVPDPLSGGNYHNNLLHIIKTINNTRPGDRFRVAELGIGAASTMEPIASLYRPDIAIVTLVGLEHFTLFRNKETIAAEKSKLVAQTQGDGLVILNADDPLVLAMRDQTKARIVTIGTTGDPDYLVEKRDAHIPQGLALTIKSATTSLDLSTNLMGEHFWLPVAAAAAAALECGIAPDIIAAKIATFQAPRMRCQPYEIKGGPTFILDSAKAPAGTLHLAFKMLADAKAPRKRMIIGTISDYSGKARSVYRRAYKNAIKVADQVIFVGPTANRAGPSPEDIRDGKYVACETVAEAAEFIKQTATPDEVILIKGSANLNLERIAFAQDQQVNCWVNSCGIGLDCAACGLFPQPFNRRKFKAKLRQRNIAKAVFGSLSGTS